MLTSFVESNYKLFNTVCGCIPPLVKKKKMQMFMKPSYCPCSCRLNVLLSGGMSAVLPKFILAFCSLHRMKEIIKNALIFTCR